MTARKCFTGKISSGRVNAAAGQRLLDMLEGYEAAHKKALGDTAAAARAAADTLEAAERAAARKTDLAHGAALAQANVLRVFKAYDGVVQELASQPGDFGFGTKAPVVLRYGKPVQLGGERSTLYNAVSTLLAPDRTEIGTWGNAFADAKNIRAEAHKILADAGAIEDLRPKKLGLADETLRETETLRAAYGQATDAQAVANWNAFHQAEDLLADYFIGARGALQKMENYFPNPGFDRAKVQALGFERFRALMAAHNDRARMLDFETGKPLTDARYEQLVKEAYESIFEGSAEGLPTSAAQGKKMLASARTAPRLFQYKSAESWLAVAEATGTHTSPLQAMAGHINGMAEDIAMLRNFGPNPEGTRRFIHSMFDREAARLAVVAPPDADTKEIARITKLNRKIAAEVEHGRKRFDDLWSEVTGENDIPVNTTMATALGDSRNALVAAQMGGAVISSISDTALLAMTARFNGLPVMNVISRATAMMSEKGSEIFAAQQGVIADTLLHAAGKADRISGETIRIGMWGKAATAVIRGTGLRRWTAVLKAAFSLEFMAHGARELGKALGELDPQFRAALARYGIGEAEWKIISRAQMHEPRPGAPFLRAEDIRAIGDPRARDLADRWSRMILSEMDYAVIDQDPRVRAIWLGDSRPGTIEGEIRRGVGMYKMFPSAVIGLHMARAFARGFDGSRLSYGALTFIGMTLMGALAMQAKDIAAGREPRSLDPRSPHGLPAWGAAILQGGGLGVFGDMLAVDKTRFGNSWAATIAGSQMGAIEAVAGDFLLKNLRKWSRGEETQFAGDALYIAGRYMPGSSVWYARAAFQRAVLDQLALMIDPRAPERLQRMEARAREDWGQSHWWRPGRAVPEFAR